MPSSFFLLVVLLSYFAVCRDRELSITGRIPWDKIREKFPRPIFSQPPAFTAEPGGELKVPLAWEDEREGGREKWRVGRKGG